MPTSPAPHGPHVVLPLSLSLWSLWSQQMPHRQGSPCHSPCHACPSPATGPSDLSPARPVLALQVALNCRSGIGVARQPSPQQRDRHVPGVQALTQAMLFISQECRAWYHHTHLEVKTRTQRGCTAGRDLKPGSPSPKACVRPWHRDCGPHEGQASRGLLGTGLHSLARRSS